MKTKKIIFTLMVMFLITILFGCSQSTSTPDVGNRAEDTNNEVSKDVETDTIVFKLGHGTPTNSLYHKGSEKFKELIEEKTNGNIKVEIYSDGSIGHDNDLVNLMKTGNVHMGMIGVEPLTTMAPKLKVVNMPYIFLDRESAYKVLDGEIGSEMVEELPEKHGIRVLAYFENGFRHVTNSKHEILTPDDLKGLKIRTPQSPVSMAIFKAFGANPVPMSFGELYTALEQKTVVGQENPLSLTYNNKFYEVQDYVSLTGHMYSPMVLTISEKVWAELSPELQKAVLEAANEARDFQRKLSAEEEEDLIKKLEEAGVTISRPDIKPFIEATKDVHNEFDGEYGSDFYKKVVEAVNK
ncbi:TRAP transporter substrate-binding protein [Aeribacillus sp. FSL K6-8394]|uniref:TRAP transporter substrate-binding protein n=1 Tax=Aeribacillus sp. FSL K6-8394 TaxID=2954570 RepID=UPI0030F6ADB0